MILSSAPSRMLSSIFQATGFPYKICIGFFELFGSICCRFFFDQISTIISICAIYAFLVSLKQVAQENLNFKLIFCCRYDWHPRNHISFHSNLKLHKSRLLNPQPDNWESVSMFDRVQFDGKPPLEQTMWPDHCIQGTDGAKLHKELKFIEGGLEIYKGFNHSVDSYSAFWDNGEVSATGLLNELNSRNVTDVYVCGLATDICVNFTATHACKHNFRVILGKS